MFPTVEELTCEGKVIGHSREGRPIRMVQIGKGDRTVLLFSGGHPDEPAGGVALLHLLELLKHGSDRGWKWLIIPCINPDGVKKNEGWYPPNFTSLKFWVESYKDQDVEYGFPPASSAQPTCPEIRALMRIIDKWKPDLTVSLHSAKFPPPFVCVSKDLAGATHRFQKTMEKYRFGLRSKMPDEGITTTYGAGVFGIPLLENRGYSDAHTYMKKMGHSYVVIDTPIWEIRDPKPVSFSLEGVEEAFSVLDVDEKIKRKVMQTCKAKFSSLEDLWTAAWFIGWWARRNLKEFPLALRKELESVGEYVTDHGEVDFLPLDKIVDLQIELIFNAVEFLS